MLPLPNLDDRRFEQMVREARNAIPKLLPRWTDENAHDPGITMLELLAWLTEMQQYYLNRITERNELKFLKLLGVRPKEARPSTCEVVFTGAKHPLTIPRGTPLSAYDQTFETDEPLSVVPAVLEKVLVRTEAAAGDFTSNLKSGIAFYAFGAQAAAGSKLFVGFDRPLPERTNIVLSLALSDRYPVPIGRGEDGESEQPPVSSAAVSWTYAGEADGESWLPVETVLDTTAHLTQSGRLTLRINGPMKPVALHPADDRKRYWLCCTLEREGYELPPKLERVAINAVKAVQRRTLVRFETFDASGEPGLVCEANGYLAYAGKLYVQVRDDQSRWTDWTVVPRLEACGPDDACCELERDADARTVRLRFGDGTHGAVPAQGEARIRLVAFAPETEDRLWVGASNGLPGQQFDISRHGPYRRSGMVLQVAVMDRRTGKRLWEDWMPVDDFDNSRSTDRHYVYDPAEGVIRFGDNERGRIPPKSDEPNIRFVYLQTGGGQRGNVKSGMIDRIAADEPLWAALTVTNPGPAHGGIEAETLREAKLRVQRELDKPTRAVTAQDYEAIARRTPGLRVARVKAIPLYKPGMSNYPEEKAPGQMTVVVVPYSEREQPRAGPGFLETVHRYLDRYRLLTTELHVIPAVYVKVTVHAVVVVEPARKDDAAPIVAELKRLLRPMGHGDGDGWPFGRSVHKGDIYGAISRLNGVVYVQDLWIDAEGPLVRKDSAGDIHLPPHGLVYSGGHDIELIGVTDI